MARYRDHYEFCLSLMWQRRLDARGIKIEQSFFSLGGDVDSAQAMLAEVERHFAVRVPEEQFSANPNIEGLGAAIRAMRDVAGMKTVPFRVPGPDSNEVPLVFLHGVEGDIFYNDRIFNFNLCRPIIAVRSIGMDLEERPLTTVEAMARRYIADLDEMGVVEPYLFVGVCSSGVIAYEMTQQLEAQGKRVGYLGLFEPPMPRPKPADIRYLKHKRIQELCQLGAVKFDPERLENCVKELKDVGEIPADHSFQRVERLAEIFAYNSMAKDAYLLRGRVNCQAVLYESRAFGEGLESDGTLADPEIASRPYEQHWAQYLTRHTIVRRQKCDHRALDQTLDTCKFLRDDIKFALSTISQTAMPLR